MIKRGTPIWWGSDWLEHRVPCCSPITGQHRFAAVRSGATGVQQICKVLTALTHQTPPADARRRELSRSGHPHVTASSMASTDIGASSRDGRAVHGLARPSWPPGEGWLRPTPGGRSQCGLLPSAPECPNRFRDRDLSLGRQGRLTHSLPPMMSYYIRVRNSVCATHWTVRHSKVHPGISP